MGKIVRPLEGTWDIPQGNASLIKNGLNESEEQRAKRIEAYGDNEPIVKPSKTLWEMVKYD